MHASEVPSASDAAVHILNEGYVRRGHPVSRVASTVTLIINGGSVIIVDPGMVASREALVAALSSHGPSLQDVTDIVFSHHHPDHTVNAGLFPDARIHDYWAVYERDVWLSRDAECVTLSPSVRLIRTPGYTAEDITTIAAAPDGLYACTHAWWGPDGPADDPHGDAELLHRSRERILRFASVIVPGHGPAFRPDANTPR